MCKITKQLFLFACVEFHIMTNVQHCNFLFLINLLKCYQANPCPRCKTITSAQSMPPIKIWHYDVCLGSACLLNGSAFIRSVLFDVPQRPLVFREWSKWICFRVISWAICFIWWVLFHLDACWSHVRWPFGIQHWDPLKFNSRIFEIFHGGHAVISTGRFRSHSLCGSYFWTVL